LGCPPNSLVPAFQQFYESGLAELRLSTEPQPATLDLVRWSSDAGYTLVVAADPVTHSQTIRQYMRQGGLQPDGHPFRMLASLESMHFAKPHPHYYDEILARIDVRPDEALMVGDDWQADIQAAARAGLNTFWVTDQPGAAEAPPGLLPDGQGALADLLSMTRNDRWLEGLRPRERDRQAYLASLLGTLAAIDNLLRETGPDLVTHRPDHDSWSMRDAICHLRDHETEVDRPRLRQVLEEDNPFISATSYDPRAYSHEYTTQDAREALHVLTQRRTQTIAMLDNLPPSAWERPARHSIFGPTSLGELVKFMADHDRIHLRQMRDALATARQQSSAAPH
jgi:hypothetical protein